jgi:hypothetical protein
MSSWKLLIFSSDVNLRLLLRLISRTIASGLLFFFSVIWNSN